MTTEADKDAVGRARRGVFRAASYPASTPVAVAALVFPEWRVGFDAIARLDVDLRTAH